VTSASRNCVSIDEDSTAFTQQDCYSTNQTDSQSFLLSSSSNKFTVTPAVITYPHAAQPKTLDETIMDETRVPNNDLAELEAWLLSDAVIRTDDVV